MTEISLVLALIAIVILVIMTGLSEQIRCQLGYLTVYVDNAVGGTMGKSEISEVVGFDVTKKCDWAQR